MSECFFCQNSGGEELYNCDAYRIIEVDDSDYPGYLRVVLNPHLRELTDLSFDENINLYQAVIKCEQILRQTLNPEKINIASFGNVTPHIHWHIIPRFSDDKHFPNPIWGEIIHPDYQPSSELIGAAANLRNNFKTLFLAL
jgi:diadenosine tetraphosphate (Ap4A) HIT family hydrolase